MCLFKIIQDYTLIIMDGSSCSLIAIFQLPSGWIFYFFLSTLHNYIIIYMVVFFFLLNFLCKYQSRMFVN